MKRRRWFRRNERGQLHVVEAVIVGIMVFTVLSITAIFRLPTSPGTFQQSELERLANDTLHALAAKPPVTGSDCNESPCPFTSELERLVSLAVAYEGATAETLPVLPDPPTGSYYDIRTTDPIEDYIDQALPPGTRYIFSYSNGVNDTRIAPLSLIPPNLDVSVGHQLLSPRWTQFQNNLTESVLVRIGEITAFDSDGITSIRDPLNRPSEEWQDDAAVSSHLHRFLFGDTTGTKRVPESALYGTYKIVTATCPATTATAACRYFTVVPPGVFGAGSAILPGDRDNSTSLTLLGNFWDYVSFRSTGVVGSIDTTEALYLDFDSNNQVTSGDVRLTPVTACSGANTRTCQGGTFPESTNTADWNLAIADTDITPPRIRTLAGDGDLVLDETEYIYIDIDDNNAVSAGDRRLSRFGTFGTGTVVSGADPDAGQAFTAIVPTVDDVSSWNVYFSDANADGNVDPGEPVYLDLVGKGQSAGLEAFDLHLTAKGSPTVRYVYDIRLVVWFGI